MALAKFTMLGRLMDQAQPYDWTQTFTLSSGYEHNSLTFKLSAASTKGSAHIIQLPALINSCNYLYVEVLSALSTTKVMFTTSQRASTGGDLSATMNTSAALLQLTNGQWALMPLGNHTADKNYWVSYSLGNAYVKMLTIGL